MKRRFHSFLHRALLSSQRTSRSLWRSWIISACNSSESSHLTNSFLSGIFCNSFIFPLRLWYFRLVKQPSVKLQRLRRAYYPHCTVGPIPNTQISTWYKWLPLSLPSATKLVPLTVWPVLFRYPRGIFNEDLSRDRHWSSLQFHYHFNLKREQKICLETVSF